MLLQEVQVPLEGAMAYEEDLSPVSTDQGYANDFQYTDADADLTIDENDLLVALGLVGPQSKKRQATLPSPALPMMPGTAPGAPGAAPAPPGPPQMGAGIGAMLSGGMGRNPMQQ